MTQKQKTETSWVKIKPQELEKTVVELSNKGTPPEKIGLILRDQHGVPKAKLLGKKIGQILKENGIDTNSEHDNVAKKIDILKKHFEKNKHDYTSKKALITISNLVSFLLILIRLFIIFVFRKIRIV